MPEYPQTTIETLIDKMGLEHFLECVSIVLAEKSDHISDTWQDHRLASRWATVSKDVSDAASGAKGL